MVFSKPNSTKKKGLAIALACMMALGLAGAYAKYITDEDNNGNARVAKWGVTITANSGDLFSTTYKDANEAAVVTSSGSDNVVAPGTSGSFAGFTLGGTPEVAVKVSTDATFAITGWSIPSGESTAYYCPLKVTVGDTSFYGLDYESADAFVAAVNNCIKGFSKEYAPNTNLASKSADVPAVSWEWAFEGANGSKVNRTDASDTALGNLATAPTVSFMEKVTVTQINAMTAH